MIYFKDDRRLENISISGNSFTSYNDTSVAGSKAKNGNRPKFYIKVDNANQVRGMTITGNSFGYCQNGQPAIRCSATDNLAVVGNTISNEGNTKGNNGVSFYSDGNPRNVAFNVGS